MGFMVYASEFGVLGFWGFRVFGVLGFRICACGSGFLSGIQASRHIDPEGHFDDSF